MNEKLRDEILQMFSADQAAVQEFVATAETHRGAFEAREQASDVPWPYALLEWDSTGDAPAPVTRVIQTVARNISRLREVVAEHGWPGRRLVGEDGADAAWTLLRHAGSGVGTIGTPEHVEFQRECLPSLETGVHAGDVHPRQFAGIVDALHAMNGQPPKYAVQSEDYEVIDGAAVFRLPVDLETIDSDRVAIGLPPLAEDISRRMKGDRLYLSGPLRADPWPPLV